MLRQTLEATRATESSDCSSDKESVAAAQGSQGMHSDRDEEWLNEDHPGSSLSPATMEREMKVKS